MVFWCGGGKEKNRKKHIFDYNIARVAALNRKISVEFVRKKKKTDKKICVKIATDCGLVRRARAETSTHWRQFVSIRSDCSFGNGRVNFRKIPDS